LKLINYLDYLFPAKLTSLVGKIIYFKNILLDEVSVNFIPKQYGIFNKFQEESALLALHDKDLLYYNKGEK
jgi:hypothetical protein